MHGGGLRIAFVGASLALGGWNGAARSARGCSPLLPERHFLLGGERWEGRARPPNVRSLGPLPACEHNARRGPACAVLD